MTRPVLVLGGYSYGSLIASHLPTLDTIQDIISSTHEGSLVNDIRSRALELAKKVPEHLDLHISRGRNSIHGTNDTSSSSSPRGLAIGGHESALHDRRVSKDSLKHNVEADFIRQRVDKVRDKLGSRSSKQLVLEPDHAVSLHDISILPRVTYLLVSPLLPPVSGLTTMFSELKFEWRSSRDSNTSHDTMVSVRTNLTQNPTLAIYGSKDKFTSSRKLHRWADGLKSMSNSSFASQEIQGAGHFWIEDGVESGLCHAVQKWISDLVDQDL
jgi:pimeloyl-ACP methyl ester carboxylesterase